VPQEDLDDEDGDIELGSKNEEIDATTASAISVKVTPSKEVTL